MLHRGGEPVILEVYANDFAQLRGVEVEPELWWELPAQYISDYDYLTAPISGMEWADQIKFNPHTYARLVVLLP